MFRRKEEEKLHILSEKAGFSDPWKKYFYYGKRGERKDSFSESKGLKSSECAASAVCGARGPPSPCLVEIGERAHSLSGLSGGLDCLLTCLL